MLTPELENTLREVMIEKNFKKGETIQGEANLSNFTFYIQHGSARVYYTLKGKEFTTDFIFEDHFIVASQTELQRHPQTLTIQFLENTQLIYIPRLAVKDILDESKAVKSTAAMLFMINALFRHIDDIDERLTMFQILSAPERYAWLINRFPRITQTATITQIASYLGLTKETLYRIRHNRYN